MICACCLCSGGCAAWAAAGRAEGPAGTEPTVGRAEAAAELVTVGSSARPPGCGHAAEYATGQ